MQRVPYTYTIGIHTQYIVCIRTLYNSTPPTQSDTLHPHNILYNMYYRCGMRCPGWKTLSISLPWISSVCGAFHHCMPTDSDAALRYNAIYFRHV